MIGMNENNIPKNNKNDQETSRFFIVILLNSISDVIGIFKQKSFRMHGVCLRESRGLSNYQKKFIK